MKNQKCSPEQILELWEKSYFKLSPGDRRKFKSHQVTKKLTYESLVDIKVAIILGKKKYLPEILEYVKPLKVRKDRKVNSEDATLYKGALAPKNRPHGRLRAVVPVNPTLWVGNYSINLKETSSYNCAVCESPVIGLRCKCSFAA